MNYYILLVLLIFGYSTVVGNYEGVKKLKKKKKIIFPIFPESIDCSGRDHTNAELRLKTKILCDYDSSERPITKNGTEVKIRMYIKRFDFVRTFSFCIIYKFLGHFLVKLYLI